MSRPINWLAVIMVTLAVGCAVYAPFVLDGWLAFYIVCCCLFTAGLGAHELATGGGR